MALIDREQALSHPFANGQYDKEHADEHFIMGFEDYKEWLEDLPTVDVIPKADYENRLKADLEAILVDLQLEIEEQKFDNHIDKDTWNSAISVCSEAIQEKINALKGDKIEV